MYRRIKNKIDRELVKFTQKIDKVYAVSKTSTFLFNRIKDFVLRKGKRIRPLLFIAGYLGFKKNPAGGLYTSALSIELLHDFMLVHDDIIDKSDTRRGRPAMHKMLQNYLRRYRKAKCTGEDLGIIVGDLMYVIGIKTFLSIKEDPRRKERALKKLIDAAVYTGSGQFLELLSELRNIESVSSQDIYKIYDYKTGRYTFSTPLAVGAILAGASQKEVDKLFKVGVYLGRAFQIRDDIIGMFANLKASGKPVLSDLQAAKKTILIWAAFNNSDSSDRKIIKRLLSKKRAERSDLIKMRKIIKESGALEAAEREISLLAKRAQDMLAVSTMDNNYKGLIFKFSQEILKVLE